MLPGFLQADGLDTVAEWRRFQAAHPDEAADTLAALVAIGIWGPEEIPDADRGVQRNLFGRRTAGWAVFYTLAGPFGGPWSVTVLHVAAFDDTTQRRRPRGSAPPARTAVGQGGVLMTDPTRPGIAHPILEDLLPEPAARARFEETSAALEAAALVRRMRRHALSASGTRGISQTELARRVGLRPRASARSSAATAARVPPMR